MDRDKDAADAQKLYHEREITGGELTAVAGNPPKEVKKKRKSSRKKDIGPADITTLPFSHTGTFYEILPSMFWLHQKAELEQDELFRRLAYRLVSEQGEHGFGVAVIAVFGD